MTSFALIEATYTPTIHARAMARKPTWSRMVQLTIIATSSAPREITAASMGGEYSSALKRGLNPDIVGRLVLEGIQQDQFYLFTDPRMEFAVERRFDRIRQSFEWSARSRALVDSNSPGAKKS